MKHRRLAELCRAAHLPADCARRARVAVGKVKDRFGAAGARGDGEMANIRATRSSPSGRLIRCGGTAIKPQLTVTW